MQYSSLGLTSVLYNFVIIFLDLHLIVLLISPTVEFAFLIAVLHCLVNFILLTTMMPKSRSFIESLLASLSLFLPFFPSLFSPSSSLSLLPFSSPSPLLIPLLPAPPLAHTHLTGSRLTVHHHPLLSLS